MSADQILVVYGVATVFVVGLLKIMFSIQGRLETEQEPSVPARPTVLSMSPAPVRVVPSASPAPVRVETKLLSYPVVCQKLAAAVHVLIVGATGTGKSTAACSLLAQRAQAGEDILILDPHAGPNDWHGTKAVGFGRDYEAIQTMMDHLLIEMTRRYEERSVNKDYTPQKLTIFVDEWPAIQSHCADAAAFMCEVAQEGRKVGMRLIILTQSDRVESLGLSGKGDVRENFTFVLLGEKALEKCTPASSLERPAAMLHRAEYWPAHVDGFAKPIVPMPQISVWEPKGLIQ